MKHIKPYNESKDKLNEDIAYIKMMLIDLVDDGIDLQVYGLECDDILHFGSIIWIKLDCTKRAWSRSITKGGVYMKWEDIDYKLEQVLAMLPNYELEDLFIKPTFAISYILFDSIDEVIPTNYRIISSLDMKKFDPKTSNISHIDIKLTKKQ